MAAALEGEDQTTLSPHLERWRDRLEHGPGVVWLRGLPVQRWSVEQARGRFLALASALGTPVSQSAAGEQLLSVRDAGYAPDDPRFRGPHSNRELAFHTDRCDVIAFLCLRQARRGGGNAIASAMTVCNEVLARRPDLLPALFGRFPYLRHTVDPANERPYTLLPVFSVFQGHFAASLLRVLIDRADRSPEAPDLSAAQREALDLVESIAREPEVHSSLRLEPGDVLLLNNWVILHRRDAFQDEPGDPGRHLLRIWLSMPDSRPLHPDFAAHFGATAAGALRGGIRPWSGMGSADDAPS